MRSPTKLNILFIITEIKMSFSEILLVNTSPGDVQLWGWAQRWREMSLFDSMASAPGKVQFCIDWTMDWNQINTYLDAIKPRSFLFETFLKLFLEEQIKTSFETQSLCSGIWNYLPSFCLINCFIRLLFKYQSWIFNFKFFTNLWTIKRPNVCTAYRILILCSISLIKGSDASLQIENIFIEFLFSSLEYLDVFLLREQTG